MKNIHKVIVLNTAFNLVRGLYSEYKGKKTERLWERAVASLAFLQTDADEQTEAHFMDICNKNPIFKQQMEEAKKLLNV